VLDRHGVAPEQAIYAAHQNSLLRLVASGAGIALVGASLMGVVEDLSQIPLMDPAPELVIWLISRRDSASILLKRLIPLIAEVAASPL
jgi:DNA-binding transcriptional LysR family regulator